MKKLRNEIIRMVGMADRNRLNMYKGIDIMLPDRKSAKASLAATR
jgi:hypothetical protein